MRFLVAVPAYNEEHRLPDTLKELLPTLPESCDVLVVDDGSTDSTAEVAKKCGAICVSLPLHLGYGAALQTAYKFALKYNYEYLIQFDADGQHDPASIPAIMRTLLSDEADFVIGNRYNEFSNYRSPIIREIGRRFFAAICKSLSGFDLKDPTSGFKGFNRRALRILVRDGFPMDYPDADVFLMLHYEGIRIREVDVNMRPAHSAGSMHSGMFHPLWYFAKMSFSILITILRSFGGCRDRLQRTR